MTTSSQPSPPTSISVNQQGTNSGLIAAGMNINQTQVNVAVTLGGGDPAALANLEAAFVIAPRPRPVRPAVRNFRGLIGRDGELRGIGEALGQAPVVTCFGEDGIGKSAMLQHLVHEPPAGAPPDVAYLLGRARTWEELGEDLVDTFFAVSFKMHLSGSRLAEPLGKLDALVIIDDVSAEARIDDLVRLAGLSTFLVASEAPLPVGQARAFKLEGLTPDAALELIRSARAAVGSVRDLTADEIDAGRQIAAVHDGHPGRIIRDVQDAQWRGRTLPELAAELERSDAAGPASAIIARLSPGQQKVVATIAAMDGAALSPERLASLVPEATAAEIADLQQRHLTRAASPAVRLDRDIQDAWSERGGLDDVRLQAARDYTAWASSPARIMQEVVDEAEPILSLIGWAERTGRPETALALGRATEGAFALTGRWGGWERLTDSCLRAARTMGREAEVAWALNQAGVQALGADDGIGASQAFTRSFEAWNRVGGASGAAIAAANLKFTNALLAPPIPPRDDPPKHEDQRQTDPKPKPDAPRQPRFGGPPGAILAAAFVAISAAAVILSVALQPRARGVIWPADPCQLEVVYSTPDGSARRINATDVNADPLDIDPNRAIRWTGSVGDLGGSAASWHVDVLGLPTIWRGMIGQLASAGRDEILIPDALRVPGLYFVSGSIEGNGRQCSGSGWIKLAGDATASPAFYVGSTLAIVGLALALIRGLAGHLVSAPIGGAVAGIGIAVVGLVAGTALFGDATLLATPVFGILFGVLAAITGRLRKSRSIPVAREAYE